MIKVTVTDLEGKFAIPHDHPPTCANDPPWLICELKVERSGKVWIRGENTMWFRLDQCYIVSIRDKDSEFRAVCMIKGWKNER